MERMKKTEKWQNLISWCIYCTWKKFSLRRKQNLKNCEWKMKTYTVASTVPFEFSQSLMVFFYPKKETTHQQSIPDCFISHHRKNIQVSYWRERCVPCMAEDLPIIRHATSEQELSFTSLNRFPTWLRLIRNIEKEQLCRPQFVIICFFVETNPLGQRQTNKIKEKIRNMETENACGEVYTTVSSLLSILFVDVVFTIRFASNNIMKLLIKTPVLSPSSSYS